MGLNRGDLERVPASMSAEECYSRIYNWHKQYGKKEVKNVRLAEKYVIQYLTYLDEMPAPDIVNIEEMQNIFRETITNRLEWSYHIEDQYGIKIAAYAHRGQNLLR